MTSYAAGASDPRKCLAWAWLAGVLLMALGGCAAAFALWPMALLIGRSTRVLPLAAATNDIPFPYRRLLAFVLPWGDGWPEQALGVTGVPFGGGGGGAYSDPAYFWDTVCYVGWVPLLAVVFLLGWWVLRRHAAEKPRPLEHRTWAFFAVLGTLALVAAFPLVQAITHKLPGTFLRSPARQLYVTTFALALSTGVAADLLLRRRPRRRDASPGRSAGTWAVAVGVLLAVHVIDLGRHDRAFIRTTSIPTERGRAFERDLVRRTGDGRVGIDYNLSLPYNRALDDVGFFDSIILARPYEALLDLTGAPPDLNTQFMSGSEVSARALAATGTKFVLTGRDDRHDLRIVRGPTRFRMYSVPGAQPRAAFVPGSTVLRLDKADIHRHLRDATYDVGASVMLNRDEQPAPTAASASPTTMPATLPAAAAAAAAAATTPVTYERPSTDRIVVRLRPDVPGVLRVLESWDPGWRATVDGAPANVLCADDVFLAVALPAGAHEVQFAYSTPGAATGIAVSLASLCALAVLALSAARGTREDAGLDQHHV